MSCTRCFAASAFLILAVSAPQPITAQATAGQVTGIINGPSGATVPHASVTAAGNATGITRKTTSNQLGNCTVPLLEPGLDTVKVGRPGFRPFGRSATRLHWDSKAKES